MAYRSTAAKTIAPEVRERRKQRKIKELGKARDREIKAERIKAEREKAAHYADYVKSLVSSETPAGKGQLPMRMHKYLANDLRWLYGEGMKYLGDEETIREPHMKGYKGKTPDEFFKLMPEKEIQRHAAIIVGIVRGIKGRLLDVARRGYEDVEKIYKEENRRDARNFFYPRKKAFAGKVCPCKGKARSG